MLQGLLQPLHQFIRERTRRIFYPYAVVIADGRPVAGGSHGVPVDNRYIRRDPVLEETVRNDIPDREYLFPR